MIAVERLAEVFVEVADTLVDDFDVIEFLESLTRHTAEVSESASAGLLLADPHGQLQYMASSATSVKLLELFQLQYQQGPCLDCFRTGEAVVNTDLHQADERWPLFAPRAVEAGFQSVHAFPLRHRQKVIGALNLFSTDIGRLEPTDVRIIQGLADLATIGLLQERTIHSVRVSAYGVTARVQPGWSRRSRDEVADVGQGPRRRCGRRRCGSTVRRMDGWQHTTRDFDPTIDGDERCGHARSLVRAGAPGTQSAGGST